MEHMKSAEPQTGVAKTAVFVERRQLAVALGTSVSSAITSSSRANCSLDRHGIISQREGF